MGGGYRRVEELPYFQQLPGRDWQYRGSPWRRSGVFEPEEVNPVVEPYARNVAGFRAPEHVGSKQSRQQNPVRAQQSSTRGGPSVARKIIVTDGSENMKQQAKENPPPARRGMENPAEELKKQSVAPQQQALRKPRFESQESAATCIQSWRRGFLVRRTDPLKHLRAIKEVRDKLKEFQEVACKPEFVQKVRDDRMERLRFDESIMKEVLKLDSLQGVHPLVRDFRKATARDLVRLQDVTDAAVASGQPLTVDDLKYVETPVDSSNEGEDDSCAGMEELVEQPVGSEAEFPLDTPAEGDVAFVDNEGFNLPEEVSPCAYWGPEDEEEIVENRSLPGGTAGRGIPEESYQQASAAGLNPSQQLGPVDDETDFPSVPGDVSAATSTAVDGEEPAVPDVLSACRDYYLDGEGSRDCRNSGAVTPDQDRQSNPSLPQEERSKVEILQMLRQENLQLKEMIESVLQHQALSISSLTERVELLEEQLSKSKKKAASVRKARSRSRRDVEDA